MIETIRQIRTHIAHRGLGITIYELKKLCTDHHLGAAMEKIAAVENDYDLMTRFFAGGFEDAERENLYNKLELRLYNIILDLLIDCEADVNPTFKQCRINAMSVPDGFENIEETLSRYDQELSLASLDANPEEKQKELHQQLLRYRIFVFNFIYTSRLWTKTEADLMTHALLSPFVDTIDQQIILGAILLAQRTVFDVWKFKTLCTVAAQTDNLFVRERALVAIAFGMPDSLDLDMYDQMISPSFDMLLEKEGMCKELVDLQTQIILCMETKKNEKTISNEILPSLLKNSQKLMEGKESDEEKLESLLHPDNEEKQMEEIEASVDKIRNMQQNGADVFFSSFSHAKRFPFFYTLMNWFCPFYFEHPQIAVKDFKDMPMSFMKKITVGHVFCNSDKYSFILSMAQVIHILPKDLLNLMQNGEASPAFEMMTDDDVVLIRRSYLGDLYRFFNLYTDKSNFKNPFSTDLSACFFCNTLMEKLQESNYIKRVCRQLFRHHCFNALDNMLGRYAISDDLEWLKLLALNEKYKKNYKPSFEYFRKAAELAPDNKLLLSRTANAAFLAQRYNDACNYYNQYFALCTDEDDTDEDEFQLALSEICICKFEDAMNRLYRLSYNHPEQVDYRKAMIYGYMLEKKFPEALDIYKGIPDDKLGANDLLRKCITQWQCGKNEDAVGTLKQYVQISTETRNKVLDELFSQIEHYHLPTQKNRLEAMILIDLALKDN